MMRAGILVSALVLALVVALTLSLVRLQIASPSKVQSNHPSSPETAHSESSPPPSTVDPAAEPVVREPGTVPEISISAAAGTDDSGDSDDPDATSEETHHRADVEA